ncbi:hypothetical protein GUJ93_ZPchr0013g37778 [Zizania palustris]|uniref:RCD1 WWE domain-containing protein n=1 Tax=Zizania palustris TaxID=103762 RepID=A0A8J5WTP8_ZIZPA|nr:hypothetical protein GUJ93_ZPchr0013g37778 [Zizania palustris]
MDISGDVKPEIPRHSVEVHGEVMVSSVRSCVVAGISAEQRAGEVLCSEGGAWADVPGEAVAQLRRAFLERRAVAEASYGGKSFLFDFVRMARIDAATAEEAALGWVDEHGGCFFPASGEREEEEEGAETAEDVNEASSGVEERSRREPRGAEPKKKIGVCGARRPGWSRQTDSTRDNSLPLLAVPEAAIAKVRVYGAPAADVAAAVEHGVGRTNGWLLGGRAHR